MSGNILASKNAILQSMIAIDLNGSNPPRVPVEQSAINIDVDASKKKPQQPARNIEQSAININLDDSNKNNQQAPRQIIDQSAINISL